MYYFFNFLKQKVFILKKLSNDIEEKNIIIQNKKHKMIEALHN